MILNREILQSPYFSFYSERKSSDFFNSVNFYEYSFQNPSSFLTPGAYGFDQNTRPQFFEKIKKDFLSKNVSPEWILQFKYVIEVFIENSFPVRFDCSVFFSNQVFKIALRSVSRLEKKHFHPEFLLDFGVSVIQASNDIVLLVPVFERAEQVASAFRFLKVTHE